MRKYWFGYKGLSTLIVLFGITLLVSCSSRSGPAYLKGNALGTYYSIHLWSSTGFYAEQLTTEINSLLDQFEEELSNWREGSWINRFNASPAGKQIPVPHNALEVLKLCLELAQRSDGLLDPTLSPLIELWGFGTQSGEQIPDASLIADTLEKVGYDKLVLNLEKQTVLKTHRDLQLNCSAVAKGYAVDLLARLLEENGIENFLINIGGEISARGTSPDGNAWQVEIQQPAQDGRDGKSGKTIALMNRSLATSGHSQRAFIKVGKRFSHILDPRTGYPVPTETASATVVAPHCALADGLATLALIMDEEQMSELLEHYKGVEVFRLSWGDQSLVNEVGQERPRSADTNSKLTPEK